MHRILASIALLCFGLLAASSMQSRPASTPTARVIVKYKADSPVLRRQAQAASDRHIARAQALGNRVGIELAAGRGIAARTQVVFARGLSSEALAARLAQEADVEYAVPDRRRHVAALSPNDKYFLQGPPISGLTGGPEVGQWYLRAPGAASAPAVSAIDAQAAWNVTTGSASVVVAMLDTGVRFDHPDLLTVAAGGKLLPGYDFVGPDLAMDGSSLGTYLIANDGNGFDSDASDPGDWITPTEANTPGTVLTHCGEQDDAGNYIGENSSWHGTQTAGIVGALTNNGEGMASVAPGVQVLPVRVLGKCGGYDSDIQAGMYWAVNAADPNETGVPANPHPARVLNMSLGTAVVNDAVESCNAAYADAIHAVTAAGAVIVVSAGNDEGLPVSVPGNCTGVITVGGLRHVGTKVGFSSIGPEVSLSAPGGNCVNTESDQPCLYPILTTSNAGTQQPIADAAGGSIYTDAFNASVGTSFSAPQVSGTAALMLSIQPQLAPSEVLSKLKATVRPFPTSCTFGAPDCSTGIARCEAPQKDGSGHYIAQDECFCTTSTCGAGMLDAGKAVASAAGVQARISASTTTATAGSPMTLSAAGSLLTTGHSIVSYLWNVTSSGGVVTDFNGATDASTASITPSRAGTFSVQLTATDNTGITSSATQSITVAAPSSSGGGGAIDPTWLLLLLAAIAVLLRRAPPQR
ncbi:MAG: S8 family serine peptidase [Proteobacteria bacterium]|nr:S8 family serine peptidase [Pseudomonadota bacterium]